MLEMLEMVLTAQKLIVGRPIHFSRVVRCSETPIYALSANRTESVDKREAEALFARIDKIKRDAEVLFARVD